MSWKEMMCSDFLNAGCWTYRKKVQIRKIDNIAWGLIFIWHSVYVQWASNEILMYAVSVCPAWDLALQPRPLDKVTAGPTDTSDCQWNTGRIFWRHLLRCSLGAIHKAWLKCQKALAWVKLFDVMPSPRWRRLKYCMVMQLHVLFLLFTFTAASFDRCQNWDSNSQEWESDSTWVHMCTCGLDVGHSTRVRATVCGVNVCIQMGITWCFECCNGNLVCRMWWLQQFRGQCRSRRGFS